MALGYTMLIHLKKLKTDKLQGLEAVMQTAQRVVVIHSPYSGRSSKLSEAISYLEQTGLEIVNTISIADLDNLPAQGPIWKATGIEIAISGGGDGLVGGVITHIAESGLPLGILPLGTSNDIARSLHIPLNILQAVEVIARGKEVEVDIGNCGGNSHVQLSVRDTHKLVLTVREYCPH